MAFYISYSKVRSVHGYGIVVVTVLATHASLIRKVRSVHGYGIVVVTVPATRASLITDKKIPSYYLSNLDFYFKIEST